MNKNTDSGAGVPPLNILNAADEIAALKVKVVNLTTENESLKAKLAVFERAAKPSIHGRKPQFGHENQAGL